LLIQYFPYGTAAVTPIEEVLSQIIDLSEVTSSGIDVSFPSITRNKWLTTLDVLESGYSGIDASAGTIQISVLNPLINAPTVSPAVTLYAWISWDKFEVAEPGTSMALWNEIPENVTPIEVGADEVEGNRFSWKSDAGASSEDVNSSLNDFLFFLANECTPFDTSAFAGEFQWRATLTFKDINGVVVESVAIVTRTGASGVSIIYGSEMEFLSETCYSVVFEAVCSTQSGEEYLKGDGSNVTTTMGEQVVSLRALSRRFTFTQDTNASSSPLTLNMQIPNLRKNSVFEQISWLYRFTTGGFRVKYIGQEDVVAVSTVAGEDSNKALQVVGNTNSALHIQDLKLNPIVEIQVPYYCPAEILAVGSSTFTNNHYNILSYPEIKPLNSNTEYNYRTLLAASDDQSFTFLVGPPVFFMGPLFSSKTRTEKSLQ
jgi:hypothetical protein